MAFDESIVLPPPTARMKSIRFSRQIVHFLRTKGVKAVVIACNTASALALETLQPEVDIPIIGVVLPGARVAAETTKNGKIGVIATESTIESHLYNRVIQERNPNAQVFGKACPLFCPLVEEGWLKDPVTVEVANRYLEPLLATGIDTLVMGCTHYPLLRSTLREIMGDKVNLVNPAYETARELKALLEEKGLANDRQDIPADSMYQFYVSDAASKFQRFANSILPFDVDTTRLIHIEDY